MINFDWQIRRSSRRKTLSVCVYSDNRVVVAAPRGVSGKEIAGFVERKSDWVRKRLALNREKQAEIPERRFVSGEKLLYLGAEHTLEVLVGKRAAAVVLEDRKISVRVRPELPESSRSALIKRDLIHWYADRALRKILERVRHYAALIGASPVRVRVKTLRSRWGSCSTRNELSFAWNIVMAPESVLDYLVVHEMCHLVHHDHSPEYWQLVAKFLPAHREKRKWLRENGHSLVL